MPSVRRVSAVRSAQTPPLHFGDHLLPHASTFPSSLPGAPGLATCSGWTSDPPWERSIKRGTLVLGGGVSKPRPLQSHFGCMCLSKERPSPPNSGSARLLQGRPRHCPSPLSAETPASGASREERTHTLDTGVQLGFWTTENLYNSLYIYS